MKILYNQTQLQAAVNKIAAEIYKKHYNDPTPPVMICVLNGAFMFFSDLVRNIRIDCEIDFIRVKSYNDREQGEIQIRKDIESDLTNKTIYIVDDILDSGSTMNVIIEHLKNKYPNTNLNITPVALFKRYDCDVECLYGIGIDNHEWLCGYGLDTKNGLMRNRTSVFGDIK